MSLTKAQKDFIEASIDHLLDFSIEITELKKQIEELKQAFTSEVSEKHDYYFLRKCLYSPDSTLYGLEKLGVQTQQNNNTKNKNQNNKPATVGEVQQYILDLILQRINKTLTTVSLAELGLENISKIIKEKMQRPFISEKYHAQPSSMPWEQIYEHGQVYYATLYASDDYQFLNMRIVIWLPQATTHYIYNYHKIPENVELNFYLDNLIPQTKEDANESVKQILMDYFFKNIDKNIYSKAISDKNFNKIICNEYHLEQLIKHPDLIPSFLNLSATATENLINVVTTNLLKSNLCNLEQAKQLTGAQIALAGIYKGFIKDNQLSIDDVIKIKNEECKILMQPLIINLIRQKKLTVATARSLTDNIIPVLTSAHYMDFLCKEDINWNQLANLRRSQCNLLLNKKISDLIINGITDITMIIHALQWFIDTITNEYIYNLLMTKRITIADIFNTPLQKLELIASCKELYEYLQYDFIKLEELKKSSVNYIIEKVFCMRLLAIYQREPYYLDNQPDDINKITIDINKLANNLNLSALDFQETILEKFILMIINDINEIVPSKMRRAEKKSYVDLLRLIKKKDKITHEWHTILSNLLKLSQVILDDLNNQHRFRQRFGFFKHRYSTRALEIEYICKKMLSLAEFAPQVAKENLCAKM